MDRQKIHGWDRPFGAATAVLKAEPIFAAVESLVGANRREQIPRGKRVVLLSPQGRTLNQSLAADLAGGEQLVLICGRYEGVDERVAGALVTDEVSIGDYVLSGGEPGALGNRRLSMCPGAAAASATTESFRRLLDYPHYATDGLRLGVPEVLLTGHHADIARWRREAALAKTKRNRPDLLKR